MGTEYLLPCRCGQMVRIQSRQAGQRVRCTCGIEIEVPTMLALSTLRQVEERPPPQRTEFVWGLRQRLLLVGGLVCLAGLIAAATLWITRPKRDDVSKYSPAKAMELWYSLNRGIAASPTLAEHQSIVASEWHFRWLIVAGVVALAGLLLMGGGWLLSRGGPEPARLSEPSEPADGLPAS